MFTDKIKILKQIEELKTENQSLKEQKSIREKELKLMEEQALAEIQRKIAEEYRKGEEQRHDYECEWHNKREKLNVELAKLEAKIEMYVIAENERNEILHEKDEQIKYLQKIIDSFMAKDTSPKIITPEVIVTKK